jgi:uncharacterized repeat protein (TIGR01451 family)
MRTVSLFAVMTILGLVNLVAAQPPQGPPMLPVQGKLTVRFQADAGVRLSYLAAPGQWKDQPLPATLSLRPGFKYLFKVEGLPHNEGVAFYPVLEVFDVLYLPPHQNPADHPAPIMLTEADGLAAVKGALVTKVVTLEDPESGFVGIGGDVNGADVDAFHWMNPFVFAKDVGRIVAVLRFGNKEPSEQELQGMAAPSLMPPGCVPGENGSILPVKPLKIGEECLRDGGDFRDPAHFNGAGKLKGLDPSDTVMTFKDRTGGKHILPSNPVCLCVPRFVSIRSVQLLSGLAHNLHAGRLVMEEAVGKIDVNQLPIRVKSLDRPDVVKSKARVDVDVGTIRVVTVYNREGTRIIGRYDRTAEVVSADLPPEKCCDEPLTLIKSCSHDKAQIGDVVTFTIKYTNGSCQAIQDVAISDNLTPRFEYIPGTAKSTREAVFVTQTNGVGSEVLRWEIRDPLPAKQTGEVSFQVRVK